MKEKEVMSNLNKFKKYFKTTCNDETLLVQKCPDCFIFQTETSKLYISLTNPNENDTYSEYIELFNKYQLALKKASKKLDVDQIKEELLIVKKSQSISCISEISQQSGVETDEYALSDENDDEKDILALETLTELQKLKIVKTEEGKYVSIENFIKDDLNESREDVEIEDYEDADSEDCFQDFSSEEIKQEMILCSNSKETEYISFDGVIYVETEGKQFYISCYNTIQNEYKNEMLMMKREIEIFEEKLSNFQKEEFTTYEKNYMSRLKILFKENVINEKELNQKLRFINEK
eukprot:gene5362-9170_t